MSLELVVNVVSERFVLLNRFFEYFSLVYNRLLACDFSLQLLDFVRLFFELLSHFANPLVNLRHLFFERENAFCRSFMYVGFLKSSYNVQYLVYAGGSYW